MKEITVIFTEKSEVEETFDVTDEDYAKLISGEKDIYDVMDDDEQECVNIDLERYGYQGVETEIVKE